MARDELVNQFGNGGEPGNVIVTPGQPFSRRPAVERAINRFGCEKNCALLVDVNDGPLKLLARDLGKPIRSFLERRIVGRATSDHAPALDPQSAKMTFAIPDQEWVGWRIRNAPMRVVRHR